MIYEQIIINTLDSLGVSRSYTGYDYIVHGLLLIIEDQERLDCITKSLYLDIASRFHTSWTCVEKKYENGGHFRLGISQQRTSRSYLQQIQSGQKTNE